MLDMIVTIYVLAAPLAIVCVLADVLVNRRTP